MAQPHETALRTVARITLTLGMFGCIEDAPAPDPDEPSELSGQVDADAMLAETTEPDEPDEGDWPEPDAALLPDAIGLEDAGEDAGVLVDAAPELTPECEMLRRSDWPEFLEQCCQGDFSELPQACTPWGPPVPPHMEGTADVA